MKVSILVTHLLGTGHLARALTLARAYLAAGHKVRVLSGGMPAMQLDQHGVDVSQLPPVRSDGVDFTRLLQGDGSLAKAEYLAQREAALLDELTSNPPDVFITELFPFGRRILRHEFRAAIDLVKSQPQNTLICASIRDILAPPSKPEKAQKTHAILAQLYDAVLVHADREVTPLELSWPVTPQIEQMLHYTGFVAPPVPQPHPDAAGHGEILVSAGGGEVGGQLFDLALKAAELDAKGRTWRILVGGQDASTRARDLGLKAPANVVIEPARKDFRQMLHHATASVSMCGYNTALDILQTGCAAVFVPFDAGSEVEQSIRAKALAQLPGIALQESQKMTPASLLHEVNELAKGPKRPPRPTGFDGARETVRITSRLRELRT